MKKGDIIPTMMKDNNPQGIGNDIIEIERVRQSIDRHGQHFLNRLFSSQEQDYCYKFKDPVPHFAARFCGKEAIVKALGTGFGESVTWLDMEILNDVSGKPVILFSEHAIKHFSDPHVLVTISHSKEHATAFAIWQQK